MSTESAPQVTTASIDRSGVSVATSSRNVRSARAGTIYDQAALAAAQPVWFHPMPDGGYLAVFSRRLTGAAPGEPTATGTILHRSATVVTEPCWSRVDPRTGRRGDVESIPSLESGSRTLTAAATRGDFLFTLNLHRAVGSQDARPLLQNFRVTAQGNIVLEGEEFIPGGLGLGLHVDRSNVWVFGDGGGGRLALARKNWGRVGSLADPNAARNWQYRGQGGWYSDPAKLAPLPGVGPDGLPADGPCSVALLRDRFYLAATAKVDRVPAVPGTPTGATTGAAALAALRSAIEQLTAVLNGALNGFLRVGPGLVSIVTELLARASDAVSGESGSRNSTTTGLVSQFLNAVTGTGQQAQDPGALLAQVMGSIAAAPVVGGLAAEASDFLEGVFTSALGLLPAPTAPDPAAILTGIVETLTGTDLTTGTGPTGTTGGRAAVPASWHSRFYTSRRVDETWSLVGAAEPIPLGDEDTYLGGGVQLQPQLALSRGFDNTVTTNGVTVLDPASHHVQVFSGSASQTVVLPSTSKVSGTTIEPDGSVTVPISSLPNLSIADASVAEGGQGTANIRFTVTSTLSPDTPVTVDYQTVSGTATPGQDYVTASGTLTIDGGTTSKQVSITVNGDTTVEADERFTVTLSNPSGAVIARATATGTITNDDSASALADLLDDLKNIMGGVASGAISTGSALVSTVSTILEQSARTITGVVGDVGSAVLGLVEDLIDFVSGGQVDLPGSYSSPGQMLASILDRITGGTGAVSQSVTQLGVSLFSAITSATDPVTDAFRQVVNGLTGILSFQMAAGPLTLLSESPPAGPNRVTYMSYTIHNQSTADLTVVSSGRGRTVTVPHGAGVVFTPYRSAPAAMDDWSWSFAATRAPVARVGFAHVRTVGVGTAGDDPDPTGDFTLDTRWSVFDPAAAAAPAAATPAPAPAPGTTAADPDLLRRLVKQFTAVTNQVSTGALSINGGVVDTVNSLLLGAVAAMTGTPVDLPGGEVRSLTTGFLQALAEDGPVASTATSLENLIRQITGGTGLTGGMVQGTAVTTPLEFVEQVADAAGDAAGEVLTGLSNLFAQIVNAITG